MLNETGDLVKRKSEKVDVLNAFFVSVFSGKTIMLQESQVLETKEKDWSKEDVSGGRVSGQGILKHSGHT